MVKGRLPYRSSNVIDDLVLDDSDHPSALRRRSGLAICSLQGRQKGFLNEIFRDIRVSHAGEGKPIEIISVLLDPLLRAG